MKKLFGLGIDPNKTISRHNFRVFRFDNDAYKNARDTLGSGDLTEAVKVPPGESENGWLAVNTIEFFHTTNLLYGCISSEFCTDKTCPVMNAGSKYEYKWLDTKTKKTIKLSAPAYVQALMDWIETLLNKENVFPSDAQFPKEFTSIVKNIFKRMFRVYAHIYYGHYSEMVQLGMDKHLNTAFKHFIIFVKEFDLIEKQQLEPLRVVITNLLNK